MISRLLITIALSVPLLAAADDAAGLTPAAPVAPATPAQQMPLSLPDCIARARSSSKSLRQARRQIAIADWQVREAWAPALPHISAGWKNTWRNNDMGASMGDFSFVTGDRSTAVGALSATLTVMDFGKSGWYREAMLILKESVTFEADRSGQSLDLAVTKSYIGVLAATRLITVAEQEVHLLDRQLAVTEDLFKQGQVAPNDRLAVAVQRKDREQGLIKARNARAMTQAALNRLLGQDLESELHLVDILDQPAWDGTSEHATRLALMYRPDLASVRSRVKAGQAGVRSAKASLLPRIYVFGEYAGTNDSRILNKTWWDGGIGASFSIFDGGATIAQAGRALEELAQLEDIAADRLDQIRLEVRQAWLSLSSARERIAVAASSLKLAEENVAHTQDRYGQGLASSTDVLADEDRLAQARFNHAEALYDQRSAYAELVLAIGIDPVNLAPEKQP